MNVLMMSSQSSRRRMAPGPDPKAGDLRGLEKDHKLWANGREAAMQDKLDPIALFIAAFLISAMSGVAALLRTPQALTIRALLSAFLNAGAIGLAIAMVLFTYFKDNTWFLLGLCMLAGLGGMTLIGFLIAVARQGGLNVRVDIRQKGDDDEDGPEKKD